MPSYIAKLRETARKDPKRIVLPEGDEPRVLKAAEIITYNNIANVIVIGKTDTVTKIARENSISLERVEIAEPEKHPKLGEMVETFYELRKHKGLTKGEAEGIILRERVYFGGLLARLGLADGFVAGASHTTGDVARAAIHTLGLEKGALIMSSSFAIELGTRLYGDNGLFVFADCAIMPNPDPAELATIAITSGRLYQKLFRKMPRIALLSYSTKKSAKGESINKVLAALEIIKKREPALTVDGEMQLDAAIVPEVARIKAPESEVAGRANVLIFPNLDAGNIAYKLVQRLAKARVAGPLLQGVSKPASDLSRGAGVEEIIDTVAITVVRAQ